MYPKALKKMREDMQIKCSEEKENESLRRRIKASVAEHRETQGGTVEKVKKEILPVQVVF